MMMNLNHEPDDDAVVVDAVAVAAAGGRVELVQSVVQ